MWLSMLHRPTLAAGILLYCDYRVIGREAMHRCIMEFYTLGAWLRWTNVTLIGRYLDTCARFPMLACSHQSAHRCPRSSADCSIFGSHDNQIIQGEFITSPSFGQSSRMVEANSCLARPKGRPPKGPRDEWVSRASSTYVSHLDFWRGGGGNGWISVPITHTVLIP